MPRTLLVSPASHLRLAEAEEWLARFPRDARVLVVGANLDAASSLLRTVAKARGALFGAHRSTLGRVAASLAAPGLAARGLACGGAFAMEALVTRVVDKLRREGGLGRFQRVAEFPGLPRALARTLAEVRAAGIDPATDSDETVDLARIHAAYEAELEGGRVADRAIVFRLATEAAARLSAETQATTSAILDRPLLLLDLPLASVLERDLVAALAARSPSVLATAVEGDRLSKTHLEHALGVSSSRPRPSSASPVTALGRLQMHLFSGGAAPEGDRGDDIVVLSAPGESRECVEIARIVHAQAARGVAFDRMAILLRSPTSYRAHLEEALRRASVPAHFTRGTLAPDPAGRAFVALIACAEEKLSARRFAEYLSLGQVPDATREGEPPDPWPPEDRFQPVDDELQARREIALSDEPSSDLDETAIDPAAPTAKGTLRSPRRWERLIVESAAIGGLDRWTARLEALERRLLQEAAAGGDEALGAPKAVSPRLLDLRALRSFAMPLLRALSHLPREAPWGTYLEELSALATQALRRPSRVLSVLAELQPMATVGPVSLAEVRLLFHRKLTELASLPSSQPAGRIFVGPVEAARGLSFDVVFIPGVAERMFPQKVNEEPILRDRVREKLGLETNDHRIEGERLALRIAIGAAREKIFVSYPRVDLDQARPRVPSFYGLEIVRAAEGALPGFDELARRAEETSGARIGWPAPRSPELAIDEAEYDLSLLERLMHLPEPETVGTARYLLGESVHLARALRFRARRWTVKKWISSDGLIDPKGLARKALDQHRFTARSFSATALQLYASCPYRFFLSAVHHLSPRAVPEPIEELSPRDRGTLIHEVTCELLTTLAASGDLPVTTDNFARARALLDEVLHRRSASRHDDLAPAIERVWKDGIAQVRADLGEWLRRMANDRNWAPHRFELAFGIEGRGPRSAEGESAEPAVRLDCGVTLRGSIDLVERRASGALRATDYKTGKRRVSHGETVIAGGRVLQPVLYALALEKLFPGVPVDEGRLYYCTSAGGFDEVPIPLNDAARRSANHVARVIGEAIDDGFLPAAPAEGACAECEYRPVCGPYEELRSARKSPDQLLNLRRLRELP